MAVLAKKPNAAIEDVSEMNADVRKMYDILKRMEADDLGDEEEDYDGEEELDSDDEEIGKYANLILLFNR